MAPSPTHYDEARALSTRARTERAGRDHAGPARLPHAGGGARLPRRRRVARPGRRSSRWARSSQRILAAIEADERITVHGDFDVDGVCATTILVGALRELGADCDWLIPDRMADGYGLSADNVERLAERGTKLLITVDCGITAVDEVALAGRWAWT